jgi:hypothetical protein
LASGIRVNNDGKNSFFAFRKPLRNEETKYGTDTLKSLESVVLGILIVKSEKIDVEFYILFSVLSSLISVVVTSEEKVLI